MTERLINVKGLAELDEFLTTLPIKMQKNILRGAVRAAMKPVRKKARANINSISGETAKSLKVSTRSRGTTVIAKLRPKGPNAYKAIFLEYGTRRHLIAVSDVDRNVNHRRSRKLGRLTLESITTVNRRVLKIGNNLVGPSVTHPGARPHPFLRPALDTEALRAVVAFGEYVQRRMATKHGLETPDILVQGD
jgi:HK97 gp10 family phage protein